RPPPSARAGGRAHFVGQLSFQCTLALRARPKPSPLGRPDNPKPAAGPDSPENALPRLPAPDRPALRRIKSGNLPGCISRVHDVAGGCWKEDVLLAGSGAALPKDFGCCGGLYRHQLGRRLRRACSIEYAVVSVGYRL